MSEEDRNARFISKLIEMSQRGRISWEPHPSGGYQATVFGRRVRALNATRALPTWAASSVQSTQLQQETPVLEVYDDRGTVGYTFENIAGLSNLIHVASYRGSKVSDLMEQVLAS